MGEGAWSIVWNVAGGIVMALLTWLYLYLIKSFRGRCFKKVFGSDVGDVFYFVYADLIPPERCTVFSKPQPKVPRRCCNATNLTHITGGAESRSLGYLGNTFGKNTNIVPRISTDADLDSEMDLSFIALGGLVNFKTADLLDNEANTLVTFAKDNFGEFVSKLSGKTIVKAGSVDDYAIIVKIHPKNNPNRSWICCAGFGEWGTSGSAWWLSKNWEKIYKRAKDKPFACITKTKVGSDSSTEMIQMFFSQEEVEKACK